MGDHNNTTIDRDRSRALRANASSYEKELWSALRQAAKVKGLRFRRQQPVHPYIADFACMEARLLIKLDGSSHDVRQAYDRQREDYLKQRGFFIIRSMNEDVGFKVEGVVMAISEQAESLIRNIQTKGMLNAPHPNPPHKGEGTTVHAENGFETGENYVAR